MLSVVTTLLLVGVVVAAPTGTLVDRDTTVSVMASTTISTYAPYTRFASAAYCSTASTWTCGKFILDMSGWFLAQIFFLAQCKNLPGFVPYATGGDGDSVPKCMHSLQTYVVAFPHFDIK